ncbi:MAG: Ig-like domain-containing protein, partial [Gammaproteobacteria bacterium]
MFKRIVNRVVCCCVLLCVGAVVHAQESVCAVVKIEIGQELTLERQAFDAHMKISNGLDDLPLENVSINVTFEDESGDSVLASSDPENKEASFFIRIDSLEGIGDTTSGTVQPGSSAEVHWLIIPAPGAADGRPQGKRFFIGATLAYTLGGELQTMTVLPDSIQVKPLPLLTLDYFLTRDVYGDDAFTVEVEPAEPFTLGVRVQNNGLASAKDVRIDSAQPRIVENEQGLLIGFELLGSQVNGRPAAPTLLADLGDIESNAASVARWSMVTTLSGRFTDFEAGFSHADELGGELTSILKQARTHSLLRDVRVDLPGRDLIRDFLADDGDAIRVYESDNVDSEVNDRSPEAALQATSGGPLPAYRLSFPATSGFVYARLADPHAGRKVIKSVVRSDGKRIPLDNVWLSRTRNAGLGWDYSVSVFDVNSSGAYTIVYGDPDIGPVAPVIAPVADRVTFVGNPLTFNVRASDLNGTVPSLSATSLPAGARFTDKKNGSATFAWTPGQAGTYIVTYIASDGALQSSRTAFIKVNPANDTDGDGMDDAWELEQFGSLDRDGSGDFDGDGVSDLEEFLDNTDPTTAAGPRPPAIESPLYGAEVVVLLPELKLSSTASPAGISLSYAFEVYADEAMAQSVATATDVSASPEGASWRVPGELTDNTGYFWRARAYNGTLYSTWVEGRFFVNTANDAPGAITLARPGNEAEVDTQTPELSVSNSADPDRDVLKYAFEVALDADFASIVASVTDLTPGSDGSTAWS